MEVNVIKGVLYGLAAVAMWAGYMSYASAGVSAGLTPSDFVILRYGPAGLIMLMWMLRHSPRTLGGIGWGRGAALALFAGPVFVALGVGGYLFAPLSHGAVIQPSTVALLSLLLGWVVFGEAVTLGRIVGTAMILGGIVLIASGFQNGPQSGAWRGDLMFAAGAVFWVTYTALLKRWSIAAVPGTAAVAIISCVVVLPLFAVFDSFERLAALDMTSLLIQIVVQGVLSGVLALICFGSSVQLLGAGRAALFPALVPAATLIVGIPVTGNIPTLVEWTGAVLATTGLAVALGAIPLKFGSNRSRRNRA